MVIDDDPYRLLRFAGDPLPTLRELGGGDPLVFAVRTFSKIVAPGLRVGWVDTAPELRQHFGDIARWTAPEGGFFLWVTLENGVNTADLFEVALAEGVAFIPGPAFSLPHRPIQRCSATVFRYHQARPDPRRSRAAAACRRPLGVLSRPSAPASPSAAFNPPVTRNACR
jgi:DNA-binding transcriptional MocR family regulator